MITLSAKSFKVTRATLNPAEHRLMLKQEASQFNRGSWAPYNVMQKSLLQGQGLLISRCVLSVYCKTCGGTAGASGPDAGISCSSPNALPAAIKFAVLHICCTSSTEAEPYA